MKWPPMPPYDPKTDSYHVPWEQPEGDDMDENDIHRAATGEWDVDRPRVTARFVSYGSGLEMPCEDCGLLVLTSEIEHHNCTGLAPPMDQSAEKTMDEQFGELQRLRVQNKALAEEVHKLADENAELKARLEIKGGRLFDPCKKHTKVTVDGSTFCHDCGIRMEATDE